MSLRGGVLISLVVLAASVRSHAFPLPDSCGDEKVKYEVKTQKQQVATSSPEPGKAQVVFIEREKSPVGIWGIVPKYATIRFAVDGSWVGADYGSSYFIRVVDPGIHHLCANWQSAMKRLKRDVDVTSFTAEAGKTYYFEAEVEVESEDAAHLSLLSLDDDAGRYRVKNLKISNSKTR